MKHSNFWLMQLLLLITLPICVVHATGFLASTSKPADHHQHNEYEDVLDTSTAIREPTFRLIQETWHSNQKTDGEDPNVKELHFFEESEDIIQYGVARNNYYFFVSDQSIDAPTFIKWCQTILVKIGLKFEYLPFAPGISFSVQKFRKSGYLSSFSNADSTRVISSRRGKKLIKGPKRERQVVTLQEEYKPIVKNYYNLFASNIIITASMSLNELSETEMLECAERTTLMSLNKLSETEIFENAERATTEKPSIKQYAKEIAKNVSEKLKEKSKSTTPFTVVVSIVVHGSKKRKRTTEQEGGNGVSSNTRPKII